MIGQVNQLLLALGSTSEEKTRAVSKVFQELFDCKPIIQTYDADSGVSETPYDDETYQGALNRALYCQKQAGDQVYSIGLESGLTWRAERYFEEAWAVILDKNTSYVGYSSGLTLPAIVSQRMSQEKLPHNEVMRLIDSELNLFKGKDTWATYSGNTINRGVSLEEALRNAAIQLLKHPSSLYQK